MSPNSNMKIIHYYLTFLQLFLLVLLATVTEVEIVKVLVQTKPESEKQIPTTLFKTVIATTTVPESAALKIAKTKSIIVTSLSSETTLASEIESYDGPYELNKTFASIMLEQHNLKRSYHDAQPLSWNSSAFDYAYKYAADYDCSGVLTHSGGSVFGENLAIGYSPIGSINAWYDEGNSYAYGTESTYNHFTAMIWNSTYGVGCASKYCNSIWGTYIICSYYPPGNVIGYSTGNVFPLQ